MLTAIANWAKILVNKDVNFTLLNAYLETTFATMAAAMGAVDEAIKEYLLYRGFVQTLKSFELEKKDEKDKGMRVCMLLPLSMC